MIRFVQFLLVVVLVTAGSGGVSGQALAAEPCANAETSASFLSQEEVEAAVLCLANAERANEGLPDLAFNQELADAARAHADAAVEIKWWTGDADWHTNPVTGSEPQDRMHEAGYCADGDLTRAAENVYWGGATGDGAQAPTPADAVNWWMSSPGHRANILDPELTELGVGVVHGAPAEPAPDAAAVFVQNFATCSTTPTPAPTCANAETSASFLSQEEAEAAVLCLANAERANEGLPDLPFNQELADAARAHADAAVEIKWWTGDADWHTNPVTGSEPQDRMHEAGYCADGDLTRAAENVYWGGATGDGAQAPTPADAVNWWMSSPGHRANILDPELTELGVGVVHGAPAEPAPDAAAVFVQNFATCSTTPTPAPTCANAETSASFLSQEEAEAAVLCLANAERANEGLPDLAFNQELADAARAHADAAVEIKWWTGDADWHTNPVTGSEPQDRMHEAGYCADGDLTRAAENVYWGGATGDGAQAPTPADAVNWWMSSPGHRANILDPELTELGVGVVHGAPAEPAPDAAAVFVQNFATCSI